jgi:chaperonin GroEL
LREKSSSDFDKDRLCERIAGLSSGLAILKIGDFTESALKEKRARVEDALGAVKSALKGGVVPGGGKACLYAASEVAKTHTFGAKILTETLEMPFKVLSGETNLIDKVSSDPWVGYDITHNQVRNLLDEPIIVDPLLVVLASLRAAISMAVSILTVEISVGSPIKKANISHRN